MWDIALSIVSVLPWVLICAFGVVLTALRLPGTWLIVAEAAAYGWWTGWAYVGLGHVVVLVVIAAVGEVLELLMSVVAARRVGASGRASWGGLLGGFAGMLFLSFLVPVPVIGTMIGALLGCFAGAMVAELSLRKELAQGTRVGLFSAVGFVLGTVVKLAIAFVMAGILLTSVVCSTLKVVPPADPAPGSEVLPPEDG